MRSRAQFRLITDNGSVWRRARNPNTPFGFGIPNRWLTNRTTPRPPPQILPIPPILTILIILIILIILTILIILIIL